MKKQPNRALIESDAIDAADRARMYEGFRNDLARMRTRLCEALRDGGPDNLAEAIDRLSDVRYDLLEAIDAERPAMRAEE